MNYSEIVKDVNEMLTKKPEWEQRYAKYAQIIQKNESIYKEGKTRFQPKSPLYRYTSYSKVKGNIEYDIRFCGQSVATVTSQNDGISISTEGKDESTKKFFGIEIRLVDEPWSSTEASKFRAAFKKELQKKEKAKSREHHVENILLAEFGKKKSDNKKLCNIQPIRLCGLFFQMPTPLTASKGTISFAAANGGGIDILARVRHKKKYGGRRICVMELKDENKSDEPPQKVMKQAVAYATFIARLLRSESGNNWYKIFGFSNETVPDELTIDVSVVMPYDEVRNENFETIEPIQVAENTYLKLYSLYFIRNENGVREFVGSLKDDMKPHKSK